MGETVTAALISSIVVLTIALVRWLSQRTTTEARLLLRVQRYGNAYTVLPDSEEKEEFGKTILASVSELNALARQKQGRTLVNLITVITGVLGVAIAVILAPSLIDPENSIANVSWGLFIGTLIGIVNLISTLLIARHQERLAAAVTKDLDEERAASFRKGELFSPRTSEPPDR